MSSRMQLQNFPKISYRRYSYKFLKISSGRFLSEDKVTESVPIRYGRQLWPKMGHPYGKSVGLESVYSGLFTSIHIVGSWYGTHLLQTWILNPVTSIYNHHQHHQPWFLQLSSQNKTDTNNYHKKGILPFRPHSAIPIQIWRKAMGFNMSIMTKRSTPTWKRSGSERWAGTWVAKIGLFKHWRFPES